LRKHNAMPFVCQCLEEYREPFALFATV